MFYIEQNQHELINEGSDSKPLNFNTFALVDSRINSPVRDNTCTAKAACSSEDYQGKSRQIGHIQEVQDAECKTLIQHVEHNGSSTIYEYIESYGQGTVELNYGPSIKVEIVTLLYENADDWKMMVIEICFYTNDKLCTIKLKLECISILTRSFMLKCGNRD